MSSKTAPAMPPAHRLAAGYGGGYVAVWDPKACASSSQQGKGQAQQSAFNHEALWPHRCEHQGPVVAVVWSLTGDTIASCDGQDVIVWHAESGDLLCRIRKNGCMSLAFRPDGSCTHLACGSLTGEAWVISGLPRRRGETLDTQHTPLLAQEKEHGGHSADVFSWSQLLEADRARLSEDSNWAQLSEAQRALLWHAKNLPETAICSVAWSPDGRHLASASWDGCIHLWEFQGAHTLKPCVQLKWYRPSAHSARIFSLTWPHHAAGPISCDLSGRGVAWDVSGSRSDLALTTDGSPTVVFPDSGVLTTFSEAVPVHGDARDQGRWAWHKIKLSLGRLDQMRQASKVVDDELVTLPDYSMSISLSEETGSASTRIGVHSDAISGGRLSKRPRPKVLHKDAKNKETVGVVLSDKGVAVSPDSSAVAIAEPHFGAIYLCTPAGKPFPGSKPLRLKLATVYQKDKDKSVLSVAWFPGVPQSNPLTAVLGKPELRLSELNTTIKKNPGIAGVCNQRAQLPLHILFAQRHAYIVGPGYKTPTESSTSLSQGELLEEAALKLLENYPEAPFCVDGKGELPLHVAARHPGLSAGLLGHLITANQRAVRQRQREGLLPLHLLLTSTRVKQSRAADLVNMLLREAPEHAEQRFPVGDDSTSGKWPARVAVESLADGAVVRALVERFPQSANEETLPGSGAYLIDEALRHNPISDETIEVLLEHGPAGSIFKAVRVPEAARAVGAAIARKPTMAWAMQQSRGLGLIRAIDDATVACRRAMHAALFFLGRYDIDSGPPAHISKTCVVLSATDHSGQDSNRRNKGHHVVLKLMSHLDQFHRELDSRDKLPGATRVVPILTHHEDKAATHEEQSGTIHHALTEALQRKKEELQADEAAEAGAYDSAPSEASGGIQMTRPRSGAAQRQESPAAGAGLLHGEAGLESRSDGDAESADMLVETEQLRYDNMPVDSSHHSESETEADHPRVLLDAETVVGGKQHSDKGSEAGGMSGDELGPDRLGSPPLATTTLHATQDIYSVQNLSTKLDDWLSREEPLYCVVMDRADRNLAAAIMHERFAGNLDQLGLIKHIANEIALGLKDMHRLGMAHCDIKPLNIVRVLQSWHLIDLDVACELGGSFGSKPPSSGYCPPEMAQCLLRCTQDDTTPLEGYHASTAYDLWSFGCVLFALCTGVTLWQTDMDDNVRPSDLQAIAELSSNNRRVLDQRLLLVKQRLDGNPQAAALALDLLQKLLQPNPLVRLGEEDEEGLPLHRRRGLRNFDQVLAHPFMPGGLPADTESNVMDRLERMQAAMSRQLDGIGSRLASMDSKLSQLCRESQVHGKMLSDLFLRNPRMPTLVLLLPAAAPAAVSAGRFRVLRSSLAGLMRRPFGRLFEHEMRLFFVSELSHRVADTAGGEGFKVQLTREWVRRAAPYLRTGLRVVRLAAVAARLAGFPLPDIPKEVEGWLERVQEEVQQVAGEATAEEVGAELEELMGGLEEEAKGLAQRVLHADEQDGLGDGLGGPEAMDQLRQRFPGLAGLQTKMQKLSTETLEELLQSHGGWKGETGLHASEVDGRLTWCMPSEQSGARPPSWPHPAEPSGANSPPAPLSSQGHGKEHQEDHIVQLTAAFAALQASVEEALRRPAPAPSGGLTGNGSSPTRLLPPLQHHASPPSASGSALQASATPTGHQRFSSVPNELRAPGRARPSSAPRARSDLGESLGSPLLRPSSAYRLGDKTGTRLDTTKRFQNRRVSETEIGASQPHH